MKRKKIYVAMVTPFDKKHALDDEAIVRLCQHLLHLKVDGIVVAGTTGEVSSLTFEERAHLLKLVKNTVGKKAEIWMGCGTNNTDTTLKNCWQAEEIGVDGIMLITPYYVRPSQAGLKAHFSEIAKRVSLPLMLYNVPKRTGVCLEAKTLIELAAMYPNIVAYKEANYDPKGIQRILSETSIKVYCGDDGWYDEALNLGMDGIVSVAGHMDTSLLRKMADANALGIHSQKTIEKWKALSRMCFLVSSPSDIKAMLEIKGICTDEVRLPLVKLNDEEKMRVKDFLERSA